MYSEYIVPLLLILAFCTVITFVYVNTNADVPSLGMENEYNGDNNDDNGHHARLEYLESQLFKERKHNDDTEARLKTITNELTVEREKHRQVLHEKEGGSEVDKNKLEYLESQVKLLNQQKLNSVNELKLLKDKLEDERKAYEQQVQNRIKQQQRELELQKEQELKQEREMQRQQEELKILKENMETQRKAHEQQLINKENELRRQQELQIQQEPQRQQELQRQREELKTLRDNLEAERKAHERELINKENRLRQLQEEQEKQKELQRQQEGSKRLNENNQRQRELHQTQEQQRQQNLLQEQERQRQRDLVRQQDQERLRQQQEQEQLRQQERLQQQEQERQRQLELQRLNEERQRLQQGQQPLPPPLLNQSQTDLNSRGRVVATVSDPLIYDNVKKESPHETNSLLNPRPNGEAKLIESTNPNSAVPTAITSNPPKNEGPIENRFVKHNEISHDKTWIDVSKLTVVITPEIGDAIVASVGKQDIANKYCVMKIPESALPPGSSIERKVKKSLLVGENKEGEPKRFARMKIISNLNTAPTMFFHDYTPVIKHKICYDFENDTVLDKDGCLWKEFNVHVVHLGSEKLSKISKVALLLKSSTDGKKTDTNKSNKGKKQNKKKNKH